MMSISKLLALLILCISIATQATEPRIFTIGNSLTWDTLPKNYATHWHIDCNQNLQSIYDNPDRTCVSSSITLSQGLTQNTYDFVTVQPFFGTTQSQDMAIISAWMAQQPSAIFVIHTGWTHAASHTAHYKTPNTAGKMTHCPSYFKDLIADLKRRHPTREIRLNPAIETLELIQQDINQGIGPYTSLSDIYRDQIHMSLTDGRYLMHNLMRTTLGLPLSDAGFDEVSLKHKTYLNTKIASFSLLKPKILEGAKNEPVIQEKLNLVPQDFNTAPSPGDQTHDSPTDLKERVSAPDNDIDGTPIPALYTILFIMGIAVIVVIYKINPKQRFQVIRYLPALLLILAAIAKGYDLNTLAHSDISDAKYQLLQVVFEMVLALFIIFNPLPKMIWWITTITFTAFTIYTLKLLIQGNPTCGCFGHFPIPTAVTFGLDLLVLLIQAKTYPKTDKTTSKQSFIPPTALSLLIIVPFSLITRSAIDQNQIPTPPTTPITKSMTDTPPAMASTLPEPVHVVDFGYLPVGQKTKGVFTLVNTSDKPLKISKVVPQCICTDPTDVPEVIKPHSSAQILFDFNPPPEVSHYQKSLVVHFEDRPKLILSVKARLGIPLLLKAKAVDLGVIAKDQPYTTRLTLTNNGQQEVRPIYATSSPAIAVLRVGRDKLMQDQSLSYPLTIDAKDRAQGKHTLNITLHTNCKQQRQVRTSVRFEVR